MKSVLIVDNDAEIRELIRESLQEIFKINVTQAQGGYEAISHLKKTKFDLVISDLAMPNGDGVGLYIHLNGKFKTPFILFSGSSAVHQLYGAMIVVEKPNIAKLINSVKKLGIF